MDGDIRMRPKMRLGINDANSNPAAIEIAHLFTCEGHMVESVQRPFAAKDEQLAC